MPVPQSYMYLVVDLCEDLPIGAFPLCAEARLSADQWTQSQGSYCQVLCVPINDCSKGTLVYDNSLKTF